MSELTTVPGKLIEGPVAERDAIHIACAPVVAAEVLLPGEHVGRVPDGFGVDGESIGIVDPFLKARVQKGQRFWLFLYPNTITALRHEWTHPEFSATTATPLDSKSASEAYMRSVAENVGISYGRLMEYAKLNIERHGDWPEYITGGSEMEGESIPDDFWEHYERITGVVAPENRRDNFFTCSC